MMKDIMLIGPHLLATVRDIDHDKITLDHRTQTDTVRRIAIRHPVPVTAFMVQHLLRFQVS